MRTIINGMAFGIRNFELEALIFFPSAESMWIVSTGYLEVPNLEQKNFERRFEIQSFRTSLERSHC